MHDMSLRADGPYKKSARIVGEVLGKYHPHGDAAVYETMVRLAQDFSMRYVLVDGQGNFGSIDGDSAAAMRYTEARMASLGEELLVDIDKDTVNFGENFDGSLQEPLVLPASIPNLLVNGASGIAVGMSTNIPPHNMVEVCNALIYMLDCWDKLDDVTIEDLMQFIKGPDFPTGGLVYRHKDGLRSDSEDDTLVTAYATGRGKITVRAKVYIEDIGRGKSQLIINELPYQTNKSSLISRIADLVRDGKIEGISDLRDESDRQGMRIIVELQRGAEANDVITKLFKLTPLEDTFSIIMLALVDGQPRVLTLKQALRVYLGHRLEVVRRRSEYDLQKAEERAHILEGLIKALDNLDRAIEIIRKSRRVETARTNLMKELSVTEIQAQAILDMQLRRLAALERKKIDDEHKEKQKLIKYLTGLLESPQKMRSVIASELADMKDEYGSQRRTIIVDETATAVASVEALMVPEEQAWLTLTVAGKIAHLHEDGPPRVTTSDKEPPRFIVESSTTHTVYLFTANGECATIPAQQLPQVAEPPDGTHFSDLCGLSANDEIVTVLSMPPNFESGFLFLVAQSGQVKRLKYEDVPGLTNKVFTVMNVTDDRLMFVFPTNGEEEVMLTSSSGMAIRFAEVEVRPTGLPSGGMRGIKLNDGDRIVGAFAMPPNERDNQWVWNITEDGIAKISPASEYPKQGRAGQGVISMRVPGDSGGLAAATVGHQDDNIIVMTSKNKPKYMRIGLAEQVKRGRNGGDYIISMRNKEVVDSVVLYQPTIIAPEPTE